MAYHYLIDGYNLLYALPEVPKGTLQQKRDALLSLLRERRLQGRNSITVIFDNLHGGGSQTLLGEIQVIFTSGETADQWIGIRVRHSPQPQALVVVSNDQGIRFDIRGTGARYQSADQFLKGPKSASPKPPVSSQPPPAAEAITEELKKKWL